MKSIKSQTGVAWELIRKWSDGTGDTIAAVRARSWGFAMYMAWIYCKNEKEKRQKAALERLRKKFALRLQSGQVRMQGIPV